MTPAQPTPRQLQQRMQLQAALTSAFNLDELRTLCFALGLDPDNLGSTPVALIRQLLLHGERTGTTTDIIAKARAMRPNFAIDSTGGLFAGVPRLEKEVFGRTDQIEALVAQLTGADPLALALSAEGSGGVGKTTLALALAHDLAHLADPHARLQLAQQRLGDKQAFSLQAVIELSLHDLNDAAQQAWAALGAFAHKPATFSLAAAKAVGQCDAATVATLLRRNLLEKVEGGEDLTLHQTLAEAAQVRLASTGAVEAAQQRHRQFYLDLANKDWKDWRTIGATYPQLQAAFARTPDEAVLALIWAVNTYHGLQGKRHNEALPALTGNLSFRTRRVRNPRRVNCARFAIGMLRFTQHDNAISR